MTLWREINEIPSTKRDLRQFGLTMAAAFGVFGGVALWRGHDFWVYLLGAAAFFLVFGLLWPAGLKPVQKLWMTLALLMGWVMSRVILSLLFFLVIMPLGLIMRLTGKDLLDIKPGPAKPSYWRPHKARGNEDYEKQF